MDQRENAEGQEEDRRVGARPRRLVRMRRVFWWLALALVGLAVLSIASMAALETAQRRVTDDLEAAFSSLSQIDGIQRLLLLSHLAHAAERIRPDHTPFGVGSRRVFEQLDQAVSEAHVVVDDPDEAEALRQLNARVREDRILLEETRETSPEDEGALDDEGARLDASLGRVLEASERLSEMHRQELIDATVRLGRWTSVISTVRVGTAILLLGVAAVFLGLARRFLHAIGGLREAIDQVTTGDLQTRAPRVELSELQDISEQFNLMTEQLDRWRQERSLFLSSVAHDLRTPLFALRSAAQLQERETTLEGSRRRSEVIQRQVERLNRMVEDLLDASRLETGKVELRLRRGDLREVVRDCVQLFDGSSEKHTLREELPDTPVWADFDETRIVQVLVNLVSNAIKYSPDGGEVRVTLGRFGDWVRLSVADEGIGLTPENRAQLFVPFRRFSPDARIPGVGLGLAVTRRLVEAHGGRMEVESAVQRGSTFSVLLPAVPSPHDAAPGLH